MKDIRGILQKFNIAYTITENIYTSKYETPYGIIIEKTNIVWATKHNTESLRTVIKFNGQILTHDQLTDVLSALV